jgi:hypothetical protein
LILAVNCYLLILKKKTKENYHNMPFLFLEKWKKKIDTWDGMCDTYATYEIIMHRLMRPHGIAEKRWEKKWPLRFFAIILFVHNNCHHPSVVTPFSFLFFFFLIHVFSIFLKLCKYNYINVFNLKHQLLTWFFIY